MAYPPEILDDRTLGPLILAVAASSSAIADFSGGSLNGRKVITLPAGAEHQSVWEKLGITWIEPVNENPFLAKALLPEGWEVRKIPTYYADRIDVTLLDQDHIPRANISLNLAVYDRHAGVLILSKEEGERQLAQEIQAAKNKEAEAAKRLEMLQLVCSKRAEGWSEECPFGVFFIKDMREMVMRGFEKENEKRSCHGFFPSEEIANEAVKLLKKNATIADEVFTKKIDRSGLSVIQSKGFKLFNGFVDTSWWGSYKQVMPIKEAVPRNLKAVNRGFWKFPSFSITLTICGVIVLLFARYVLGGMKK